MAKIWVHGVVLAGLASGGGITGCNGDDGGSAGEAGSETMASETQAMTTTETTTETTSTMSGGSESMTGTSGGETEGTEGSCAPGAPIDLDVSSNITIDTTWQGTVRLSANIDVRDGATLTILPGTAIIVDVDGDLDVGWNSQQATIRAQGTAEQPIEFCGISPEPGSWRGITIQQNVTSDSAFEHVIIRHAGSGQASLVLKTGINIRDLLIADSGSVGIEASDFRAGSERLTVMGAAGVPVSLTGQGGITHLPLGGTYTGNGDDVIAIDIARIDADTHYREPGVPYRQERSIDVRDEAEVTFDAGVDYIFAVDSQFEVGWNSQPATLMIDGTSDAPVVFRGSVGEPGFWRGVLIRGNVTSNSRLSYLTIRDAGGGRPALSVQAPIVVDHLTLADNLEGLYIDDSGVALSSSDLRIMGTMGPPVTVESRAAVTVPTGDYSGNEVDWIVIRGGSIDRSGSLRAVGVPYYVAGTLQVREEAALTIDAGNELVMGPDTEFEVGWNSQVAELTAVGTADAPIVFRGRDPVPGWWRGLQIRQNVLSSSKIAYVTIGHGGQGTSGANLILRRAVDVTNSHFHDSASYGIRKEGDDPSDYLTPNTFADNAAGNVGDL